MDQQTEQAIKVTKQANSGIINSRIRFIKLVMGLEALILTFIFIGSVLIPNGILTFLGILLSCLCCFTLLPIHFILTISSMVSKEGKASAGEQIFYRSFMFWSFSLFVVSAFVFGSVALTVKDIHVADPNSLGSRQLFQANMSGFALIG